jgi:septum formation protein
MAELILASASKGRADMLLRAGLEFRPVPADVDEREIEADAAAASQGISGGDVAQLLAVAKAEEVSARFSTAVVIGVDQVMECDGVIYHKPVSRAAARAQLAGLRGRTHRLHSGLAVARGGQAVWRHLAVAHMTMRDFSDDFLDAYCAAEDETLLQTVGAYRIEERGVQLFSVIDGEHFTIVGLPLLPLLHYLREIGWLAN